MNDYSMIVSSIADTIAKGGKPLTETQKVLLAGAASVWFEKLRRVPDGYVLVPIEPTEEMIKGFWGEITHGSAEIEAAKSAYADMLAAAPTPGEK